MLWMAPVRVTPFVLAIAATLFFACSSEDDDDDGATDASTVDARPDAGRRDAAPGSDAAPGEDSGGGGEDGSAEDQGVPRDVGPIDASPGGSFSERLIDGDGI